MRSCSCASKSWHCGPIRFAGPWAMEWKNRAWLVVAGIAVSLGSACKDRCREDAGCSQYGLCKTRGEECVAASDADCRNAEVCRRSGQCFAGTEGCEAREAADCQASRECPSAGSCSLVGEACGAATDEDCRGSRACKTHGACRAKDGRCEPDDEACRASERCRTEGACSYYAEDLAACKRPAPRPAVTMRPHTGHEPLESLVLDGESVFGPFTCNAHCAPRTDQDCAGSEACKKDGKCVVTLGKRGRTYSTCEQPAAAPAAASSSPPAANH